jgi:Bacterial type II and III secretion system protein
MNPPSTSSRTILLAALTLTLALFSATHATAQSSSPAAPSAAQSSSPAAPSAAPAEPPTALQSAPKTYRLTYTFSEIDGTKPIGTQHYAMTTDADGRASVKLGNKVPVLTGEYHAASAQTQTQFTYVDVGLNLDTRLHEFANGIQVSAKVEKSSVADEPSTLDMHEPIIRQQVLENTAIVALGKPVMLGSLDIPGSTRHLDISLIVEAVR